MSRWVTFDCYGTLMDWTTGMLAALRAVVGDDADRLLAAYHRHELAFEAAEKHLAYRDVLELSLRAAAAQERVALPEDRATVLAGAWKELPAFEDTTAALRALKDDGWSIAVLTNCDDDLFASTVPSLGVEIDEVVTAEQVCSYKPRLGHFHEFARRTGADRTGWVHAANSWIHDIVPARRLGLTAVWVDRDRTGHDPTLANFHIPSMAALPPVLRSLTLPTLDD